MGLKLSRSWGVDKKISKLQQVRVFLKNHPQLQKFTPRFYTDNTVRNQTTSNMRILEVEHDFFKTHVPAVILKTFCQRPNFARILNP